MNEALQKLNQMTLTDSTEYIFSPESVRGTTALTKQDGEISKSGQQASHASHSAQQEKDSVKQTSDTSCRTSLSSSESVDQKLYLESKLRQLLDTAGSMIYTQKWTCLDMKLRQTLSPRALLVLRISDHVYGGLQLVQAWG